MRFADMAPAGHLDTHHKALTINLDGTIFGSFAEIGAGQPEALGILGVNLLYGLYHQRESQEVFLHGLSDDIAAGRIEIDLIDLRGAAFQAWDARALLVELVRSGWGEAVVFPRNGRALPPSELLHKKPVVLAPGRFETVEPIHGRILAATLEELRAEGTGASPVGLFAL